jgi:hypothetical protein
MLSQERRLAASEGFVDSFGERRQRGVRALGQLVVLDPAEEAFRATMTLMLWRSTLRPWLANSPASWASQMIRLLVMAGLALMTTGCLVATGSALADAAPVWGEAACGDSAVGPQLERASSMRPAAREQRRCAQRGDVELPTY